MHDDKNVNTFTLRVGDINDDHILVAASGYVFSGGYKALVKSYTYATTWTNNEHIRRFRTLDNALKYISKHYDYYSCVECGLHYDAEMNENGCGVDEDGEKLCYYLADIEIFD